MSERLERLSVKNFRSLADISIEPGSLNVLFGPNGAGKSTFLDTIWFVRDCAIRGVPTACSDRSHGIGILWDGADEGEHITITIETESAKYDLSFGFSSGRIEAFVGEKLFSKSENRILVERNIGSDAAALFSYSLGRMITDQLREPEQLALSQFVIFARESQEVRELDGLLRFVNTYRARDFFLYRLKTRGSESTHHTKLWGRGDNLWSVLRNLQGKQAVDSRYETIVSFMKQALPDFRGLAIEPTGPSSVYAEFIEKSLKRPIQASGVSDGHLQLLLLLTALFSEGQQHGSLILFDEPETSLHPHALAVFAEAVKLAASEWSKQIFVATHSPVLISQFEPEDTWVMGRSADSRTTMTRLSDVDDARDLLEQYAAGSLYMAEEIGRQSAPEFEAAQQ